MRDFYFRAQEIQRFADAFLRQAELTVPRDEVCRCDCFGPRVQPLAERKLRLRMRD